MMINLSKVQFKANRLACLYLVDKEDIRIFTVGGGIRMFICLFVASKGWAYVPGLTSGQQPDITVLSNYLKQQILVLVLGN